MMAEREKKQQLHPGMVIHAEKLLDEAGARNKNYNELLNQGRRQKIVEFLGEGTVFNNYTQAYMEAFVAADEVLTLDHGLEGLKVLPSLKRVALVFGEDLPPQEGIFRRLEDIMFDTQFFADRHYDKREIGQGLSGLQKMIAFYYNATEVKLRFIPMEEKLYDDAWFTYLGQMLIERRIWNNLDSFRGEDSFETMVNFHKYYKVNASHVFAHIRRIPSGRYLELSARDTSEPRERVLSFQRDVIDIEDLLEGEENFSLVDLETLAERLSKKHQTIMGQLLAGQSQKMLIEGGFKRREIQLATFEFGKVLAELDEKYKGLIVAEKQKQANMKELWENLHMATRYLTLREFFNHVSRLGQRERFAMLKMTGYSDPGKSLKESAQAHGFSGELIIMRDFSSAVKSLTESVSKYKLIDENSSLKINPKKLVRESENVRSFRVEKERALRPDGRGKIVDNMMLSSDGEFMNLLPSHLRRTFLLLIELNDDGESLKHSRQSLINKYGLGSGRLDRHIASIKRVIEDY
ncbi:hypothetical protein A3J22_03085 [Candidatus Beckwithbacteria bacterium RIFCSPLOWO2_02_FULL_49_12]|nr:MAG: hypothetical protein UY43_C0001G0255 [Candidatus Beckwithbacteria bacterium GW2011_GWC1_49_16]KKW02928.1 MAG: hypothetical protein UY37_C0009G0002 [Candidatus Beckwithbacteria bacterium GW2011_GWC2_49_11]OGD58728.1 MAG: hypothetical protein A3J22_03085 [Candidatus Beckwithbacteria bacterium RIFCSPLOWO2_02_FULL_49_12]HAV66733.1 hypothetical protein [Candidatus Beckwithbacteria bacterium]HCM44948.1 hypothetical protein [Candidatus Beckwithbacteria bacterium]